MNYLRKALTVAGLVFFGTLASCLWSLSDPNQASVVYDLTHKDKIDMVVMAEPAGAMAMYWREEVARRYTDAVIVLAHGGVGPDGYWWGGWQANGEMKPWTEWIKELRERFPYRRLVLISCNPGHQYLHATNVTYATESVWFFPDAIMLRLLGLTYGDPAVGDIFDFVEQ